jgi:excisionase family DNA binding protein
VTSRTAPARRSTPAVHHRAGRDEWLTVDEVCAELKISRRTFDRWRALGTGPKSKRIGGTGPVRVRRSWLDQWLDIPDRDTA